MPLTTADLFCGAGGFSEGFRQAGFQVLGALDNWAPAIKTHEKNHPDTPAYLDDIMTFDPRRLGPVDVLIGSPPCTEFSFANRGGGGDIEAGMRLVYRYLRFVYELQPKYWIMENVPRTLQFLDPEIPLRKLGIDKKGALEIPVREVLVSSDYGVPQKRARAFSGNFPLPPKTHAQEPATDQLRWRTLGDVVSGLPNPSRFPQLGEMVTDPVYGFTIQAHLLTDHFSNRLGLTEEEARENRKAKEDHSWYGRMVFPDALDRPARTVMATQLRVSRETTVIASSDGGYRRLSVREASSVQAFPVTYQWWGQSESLRYKLVGNAVAPPVAYAIACSILRSTAQPVLPSPYVIRTVTEPVSPPIDERQRPRSLSLTRRFREHVPGSKQSGLRVDIDNRGKHPGPNPAWRHEKKDAKHLVEWQAMLYRGSGKSVRAERIRLETAVKLLALTTADPVSERRAAMFMADVVQRFRETVPDATTLQAQRAERVMLQTTPYELLDQIAELVSKHYETPQRVVYVGSRSSRGFVPPKVAATLVASAFVCEVSNEGTEWLRANREIAFAPSAQAVVKRRMRSVDFTNRLEKYFSAALKRHRHAVRLGRETWAEVEQLRIPGA